MVKSIINNDWYNENKNKRFDDITILYYINNDFPTKCCLSKWFDYFYKNYKLSYYKANINAMTFCNYPDPNESTGYGWDNGGFNINGLDYRCFNGNRSQPCLDGGKTQSRVIKLLNYLNNFYIDQINMGRI